MLALASGALFIGVRFSFVHAGASAARTRGCTGDEGEEVGGSEKKAVAVKA